MLDPSVKAPGGVDGEVRVIAYDLGAEGDEDVGHLGADRSEADDAHALAGELAACEALLGLLGALGDLRVVARLVDPLGTADDVPACEQHAADDELLDGVGVGAGRVEDDDALLGAALDGDVVHAGARACHREQRGGGLDLVEVSTADEPCVRLGGVVHEGVSCLLECVRSDRRDVVHAVNGVHCPSYARCASSKSFMKLTSASTPSRGMAL